MPGYDKTGPFGKGPMTGRGRGPCGRSDRRGCFDCRANNYSEPLNLTKDERKKILQAEQTEIEEELKKLNK